MGFPAAHRATAHDGVVCAATIAPTARDARLRVAARRRRLALDAHLLAPDRDLLDVRAVAEQQAERARKVDPGD